MKWNSLVGFIFWVLAVLSFVLALVAVVKKNLILGIEPLAWYWNSLVLGVLALGARGAKIREISE